MPMKEPPHPGLAVRRDCLEPLGLTITDGAKVLGVSRHRRQHRGQALCRATAPENTARLSDRKRSSCRPPPKG
jgi:plasmid maintenance system antidote protein VapI